MQVTRRGFVDLGVVGLANLALSGSQLDDWGDTSAEMVMAPTRWLFQ